MPTKQPKVFKVIRKTINEDKDNFVVRFKHFDTKLIRQFKKDLNEFCVQYFTPKEGPEE